MAQKLPNVFANIRMIAAAFALLAAAPIALALATPVHAAGLASEKATVDAAKASGSVGEQGDGFLGLVRGSADAATTAAVAAINAARAEVYRQTAAKSGVTVDAAGQATGALLIAKVPSGQYCKPLGGDWTRK